MKAKRKTVGKRLRFEVFKRDSFACQYCGKQAPDVLLQVDHIEPVATGGSNDLVNLVTSCSDCNAGKSSVRLSDKSALALQRKQLKELQDRREQIEMMAKWQQGLIDIDAEAAKAVSDLWTSVISGSVLNERGLKTVRKHVRDFGLADVLAAIPIAADTYIKCDEDGRATQESAEIAFKKIGGICYTRREEAKHPELQELYRIRGLARHRCSWFKGSEGLALLQEAVAAGVPTRKLWEAAGSCTSWSNFEYAIQCLLEEM